jgi:hypothetical protein
LPSVTRTRSPHSGGLACLTIPASGTVLAQMSGIALTCDDGSSEWTELFLDILVGRVACATFFAIGTLAENRIDASSRSKKSPAPHAPFRWRHFDVNERVESIAATAGLRHGPGTIKPLDCISPQVSVRISTMVSNWCARTLRMRRFVDGGVREPVGRARIWVEPTSAAGFGSCTRPHITPNHAARIRGRLPHMSSSNRRPLSTRSASAVRPAGSTRTS